MIKEKVIKECDGVVRANGMSMLGKNRALDQIYGICLGASIVSDFEDWYEVYQEYENKLESKSIKLTY